MLSFPPFLVLVSSITVSVLATPLFGLDKLPSIDQVGDAIPGVDLNTTSASTSPVSASTVQSDLLRPAQFARVAYCSSKAVTSWQCGPPCDDLGNNIKVLQAGGDDGLIPMYYIAHDPSTSTIVVAHQGTEASNFKSVLNDAEFILTDIDTTRFPDASGQAIQVHSGFQQTFERTADSILQGVKSGLQATGSKKVVVTGHSLGAALALLDTMFLKPNLDPSVSIQTTVFGLPRVGNQEWADFVDATLDNTLTRISNQADPVPTVPPLVLGFRHPEGEIHINAVNDAGDATDIVSCPGQENSNCSAGNGLLDFSIANHLGPYFDNVSFGGKACPL